MIYSVAPEIYDRSIPQINTAKTVVMNSVLANSSTGDQVIIDACCGTGQLAEYLSETYPDSRIIGLDNAENMIEFAINNHARDNVTYQLDDLSLFNPSFKHSADLIICSWAVSHIPAEKQKDFTDNLYRYLKKDGQLVVLFPVLGSVLSTAIREVTTSDAWLSIFKEFKSPRMTFTVEGYSNQLKEAGFIDSKVQTSLETVTFRDIDELKCFVTTSMARYLPYIEEPVMREKLINDVSERYLEQVDNTASGIPYQVTILSAIAKRPSLANLLQKSGSPIYVPAKDALQDISSCALLKLT